MQTWIPTANKNYLMSNVSWIENENQEKQTKKRIQHDWFVDARKCMKFFFQEIYFKNK